MSILAPRLASVVAEEWRHSTLNVRLNHARSRATTSSCRPPPSLGIAHHCPLIGLHQCVSPLSDRRRDRPLPILRGERVTFRERKNVDKGEREDKRKKWQRGDLLESMSVVVCGLL